MPNNDVAYCVCGCVCGDVFCCVYPFIPGMLVMALPAYSVAWRG